MSTGRALTADERRRLTAVLVLARVRGKDPNTYKPFSMGPGNGTWEEAMGCDNWTDASNLSVFLGEFEGWANET
jgi:hypothetical protein